MTSNNEFEIKPVEGTYHYMLHVGKKGELKALIVFDWCEIDDGIVKLFLGEKYGIHTYIGCVVTHETEPFKNYEWEDL